MRMTVQVHLLGGQDINIVLKGSAQTDAEFGVHLRIIKREISGMGIEIPG